MEYVNSSTPSRTYTGYRQPTIPKPHRCPIERLLEPFLIEQKELAMKAGEAKQEEHEVAYYHCLTVLRRVLRLHNRDGCPTCRAAGQRVVAA